MKAGMVIAGLLSLATSELLAYQIVEARYGVVGPNGVRDEVVVRCEDGRLLTLPWESRLRDACGEADGDGRRAESAGTEPARASLTPPDATGFGADAAQQAFAAQKRAMLEQVRVQFGNLPSHHLEFKPAPEGLSMRFSPSLRATLKRYELCRQSTKDAATCAAQRDRELRWLAGTPGPTGGSSALAPAPVVRRQAARSGRDTAAPSAEAAHDRCIADRQRGNCPSARAKALKGATEPSPAHALR